MAVNMKCLPLVIVILQCYLATKVNGATGQESLTVSKTITGPGIFDEQDGRKQLTVDSGDSVSLTCTVVYTGNYQASHAAWHSKGTYLTQSGDLLQESDKYSISPNYYGGSTLVDYILGISDVTTEDAGEYKCTGVNSREDSISIVVRESSTPDPLPGVTIVKTEGPGSIVEKAGGGKRLTVNNGDTITLQCTVRVDHGSSVGLWYWNDVGLTYNDYMLAPDNTQFSINRDTDAASVASFSLGIHSLTPANAGEYKCQGNNGVIDSVDLVVSDNIETVTPAVISPKLIKQQIIGVEKEVCSAISQRRYDIVDLGLSCHFRGWVDVQGQGAPNDYCRVISNGGQEFLACALAGSLDDSGYTSPNASLDWFDAGHTDTWYMKDENKDGRDDYCRCVGIPPNTIVSCMQAGKLGFIGYDDFQIENSTGCHHHKVNPYFGVP